MSNDKPLSVFVNYDWLKKNYWDLDPNLNSELKVYYNNIWVSHIISILHYNIMNDDDIIIYIYTCRIDNFK